MSRTKRAAAACAAAASIACLAAGTAAAAVPSANNICTRSLDAGTCVNYTFDTAAWSVGVGNHVVDEWVWNEGNGQRSACDTWDYVFGTVCPPKKVSPVADPVLQLLEPPRP